MQELSSVIRNVITDVFNVDVPVVLTRPDEQFGDYATNIALQLSKQIGKNPREIAGSIIENLQHPNIAKAEIAGPGFINIWVSNDVLQGELNKMIADEGLTYGKSTAYNGKQVVAEYSDPNPFKVLHAGHLYTSVIGDAIANLYEYAGASVHRVNFGGDVGLHVGKTMWAILQDLGGENPDKLQEISESERSEWMARCYVTGTNAYEDDESAKQAIIELNKKVYAIHAQDDHESPLAHIYWTCREWSYDYFRAFYETIGTKFEKFYPESSVADLGLKTVKEQLEKGVFEQSDGAVVFKGEDYDLHTRVFINSEGIPTYEAKDVGLIMQKWEDYHFDKSVVITGNEQEQYMSVVLKAVEQFHPDLVAATSHLTHGLVKLQGGVKMSSRKGNILRAVDILEAANAANTELTGKESRDAVLGAVKYAFLKNRMGGDLIYDPAESVSLQGNSGTYLQYAYVRALSIIRKKTEATEVANWDLDAGERGMVKKMSEYPEVIHKATEEMSPHLICTYLYELAQKFNNFYEHNRVLNDEREDYRIKVVMAYTGILHNGLQVLGIPTPERM